ncbi:MAG TPA: hypothetical protein VLB46_04125 [Pyrinomonadaceae bacterium]|nr:hypothetical protein [Pyrinomonadaceae bacterium]
MRSFGDEPKIREKNPASSYYLKDKLDPAVNVPAAALQETLDMQVKLRDMQSNINMSLRFMDTLPQWNEKLRAWNAPTLTTRKPIEF